MFPVVEMALFVAAVILALTALAADRFSRGADERPVRLRVRADGSIRPTVDRDPEASPDSVRVRRLMLLASAAILLLQLARLL